MAALDKTVLAENIAAAQDIEMIYSFQGEFDRLAEVLGIFAPEVVGAGTTLYQYKVTGALNEAAVAEGDEVPLSEYEVEKVPVGSVEVKPYRKLTTAQAILKGGYENAVAKTDRKMLSQARAGVLGDFFAFLANGTGAATGTGLQAALAQADAKLRDALETNGDEADAFVHFVNPFDIADYLAKAEVSTQNMFGMQYLKDFLGVQNIFVTNKVAKGTLYVTPVENIRIYGVDFGSLAMAGLEYTVQDGSLIGVRHTPAYNRTSSETYVLVGATMLAEVTDYIVKGTVAAEGTPVAARAAAPAPAQADAVGEAEPAHEAPAPEAGPKPTMESTVAEIKAYAAAVGVDVPAKASKAEMLAAIEGAE